VSGRGVRLNLQRSPLHCLPGRRAVPPSPSGRMRRASTVSQKRQAGTSLDWADGRWNQVSRPQNRPDHGSVRRDPQSIGTARRIFGRTAIAHRRAALAFAASEAPSIRTGRAFKPTAPRFARQRTHRLRPDRHRPRRFRIARVRDRIGRDSVRIARARDAIAGDCSPIRLAASPSALTASASAPPASSSGNPEPHRESPQPRSPRPARHRARPGRHFTVHCSA
jgi:hypothetical protein